MILAWLARIAGSRARADSRLLLVVLAVAIVSCTSVTSLALLATVTETAGLRAALGDAETDRTSIGVVVERPTVPIAEAERTAAEAVDFLLAESATAQSVTFAQTGITDVAGPDDAEPVSAYFGEFGNLDSATTLVDGEWPAAGGGSERIEVAVPESAAGAIGLSVGDLAIVGTMTVGVVGIYRPLDPNGSLWAADLLRAGGIDRGITVPGTRTYIANEVIGPLLVAPKSLDRVVAGFGVAVESLDLRFDPDFSAVEIADLAVISDRLSDARTRIPSRIGDIGEQVGYSSRLSGIIDGIASSLLLTRATVITVGLLLVLVSIVSLAQAARLVVDSRIDERRLLRARGASAASIRGISAIEAGGIGLVVAVASPVLALLVYRGIALQPAMVDAGMPAGVGLPPIVWGVAGGTSVAFVLVLLAPLVRSAELFDDDSGALRAARGSPSLGIVRVGIDLGIAAFAALFYLQLLTYRAPVGTPSARIDPILVLAPAGLLAACSLLAMRLVPVFANALERIGSRSPGAVLSLAAWEIGRRAGRVTAVVLLLTLALGVGSFGSTFLATWRQSQTDQVIFDFGAPARVAAVASSTQFAALADGASGDPQPVIRRLGQVGGPSAGDSGSAATRGPQAQVLGLSAAARSLISRGRNGVEGGSAIERMLVQDPPDSRSIALPSSTLGITATVRIETADAPFPGVSANVSAIVEDAGGMLSRLPLGAVGVDGAEYPVEGRLPRAGAETEPSEPSEPSEPNGIVGIVIDFAVADRTSFVPREQETPADVFFTDVAALVPAPPDATAAARQPLPLESLAEWSLRSAAPTRALPQVIDEPTGSGLGVRVAIPSDADSLNGVYSLSGWETREDVPIVATDQLAESMSLRAGSRVTLVVSGALIRCELIGTVPLVPGSSTAPDAPSTTAGDPTSETASVVVIDQVQLSRALVGAGSPEPTIDEWWVDVAPGDGAAYVDRHRGESENTSVPTASVESAEVVETEQSEGPLRIATIAALWLLIGAAALLTATGFAVHTAASMRSRRTEFAQLRALGLERRSLMTVVGAESLLIGALGTVFGIAIGVLLGSTVASLVGISPDGSTPQPSVAIVVPLGTIAALALVVALVVVLVVLAVAGRQRSADPAGILRGADE